VENGLFAFFSPLLLGAQGQRTMFILQAHWKARSGLPVSVRPNWTLC